MRITIVGGGPGGLFLSVLMKRGDPRHEVTVLDRNPAAATFGFGVVFSARTLAYLAHEDPATYEALTAASVGWEDIELRLRGTVLRAGGNTFQAIARLRLLEILQQEARRLGVELCFERRVAGLEELGGADLIVAADGVNSRLREALAEHLQPEVRVGSARFIWFATTRTFDALTFPFEQNEHGCFGVHAYPFRDGASTFIVETDEASWRRAGLDVHEREPLAPGESDHTAMAYCEALFAAHLEGHRLLGNNSRWQSFPTVRNGCWHHGNVVLIGDAAHTAHFSVGSGTRMAMEDALALSRALAREPDVPAALAAFEAARRPGVEHIQNAAEPSRRWWERFGRRMHLAPEQFFFHFLTRTGLVGETDVKVRDPALVRRVKTWFADGGGEIPPTAMPLALREVTLPNRIVVPPREVVGRADGMPGEWQLVQMAGSAGCGAGVAMSAPVAVARAARAGAAASGMWTREQAAAWRRIVEAVRSRTAARAGVHLGWFVSPAARAALPDPGRVRGRHVRALELASEAGFELAVLDFGEASLAGRLLAMPGGEEAAARGVEMVLALFEAARAAWPAARPLGVLVSVAAAERGGRFLHDAQALELAVALRERGCDFLGLAPPLGPPPEPRPGRRAAIEQLLLCDQVRNEAGIATVLVGGVHSGDDASAQILGARADLCWGWPQLGSPEWRWGWVP